MPRSLLSLMLSLLACWAAQAQAQAQSSDRNLIFADVRVVRPGAYDCAQPCRAATPGFIPLVFNGVTACAIRSNLGGNAHISGTMRQGQGCNAKNFVRQAPRAFRVATGFQCLCVRAGTARWAADGACPATHEQRGACRATAAAQITPGGTLFGLTSSDALACRYADRGTGRAASELWNAQSLASYQVLCLQK